MIEVFADVWCPFTHASLRRVVQARSEGRFSGAIHVRAWPLELVNGRPLDPALVAQEVEELRRQVDPEAFVGFDAERFPKTMLPALRLSAAAYEQSVGVGEAVALELRDRLFERGEDVSDDAVLQQVADVHGIDLGAASGTAPEDEWEMGKRLGVQGSPHYFTSGGDFFCPSMDIKKVDGRISVRPDPAGFDRFLASISRSDAPQS